VLHLFPPTPPASLFSLSQTTFSIMLPFFAAHIRIFATQAMAFVLSFCRGECEYPIFLHFDFAVGIDMLFTFVIRPCADFISLSCSYFLIFPLASLVPHRFRCPWPLSSTRSL
jgi:hypothetical protein